MHSNLKIKIYTILSVIGFIIPNWIVAQTIINTGRYDFNELLKVASINDYSRFISADLALSALVFGVFFITQIYEKSIKHWWIVLLGTLFVGLSFGFPLLLLIREIELRDSLKK